MPEGRLEHKQTGGTAPWCWSFRRSGFLVGTVAALVVTLPEASLGGVGMFGPPKCSVLSGPTAGRAPVQARGLRETWPFTEPQALLRTGSKAVENNPRWLLWRNALQCFSTLCSLALLKTSKRLSPIYTSLCSCSSSGLKCRCAQLRALRCLSGKRLGKLRAREVERVVERACSSGLCAIQDKVVGSENFAFPDYILMVSRHGVQFGTLNLAGLWSSLQQFRGHGTLEIEE